MTRNPQYYSKELLQSAYLFDSQENEYSISLIDKFNNWIQAHPDLSDYRLTVSSTQIIPKQVIWIDASQDNLPATRESCRIIGNGTVVNKREELLKQLEEHPSETLLLSHCVKKECYDVELSRNIEKNGSISSPGPITAPGSLFSDKKKTYEMLSFNRTNWDLVAKFFYIHPDGKNPHDISREIIDTVESDTETDSFFIKPTEGGGGLGGFRLLKISKNGKTFYIIPDLSKLSGEFENPHIVNLTVDPDNGDVINELWWLYSRFRSIDYLKKNYINTELDDKESLSRLLTLKTYKNILDKETAISRLTDAIEKFEKKFNRKYIPLVSHYVDFGTWGLRAHYRLTSRGIQIETLYSRLFQIRFDEDGIGYVGSDNISNKQTGELELDRLVPLNDIMVRAIGGEKRLLEILLKGAIAMKILIDTLPPDLKFIIPIRVQFDLAAVSATIGEGNADTARGFCLAQNWDTFILNTKEWYNDSLGYYCSIKSR